MDKQKLKEWRYQNDKLQYEYKRLYNAHTQREKEIALRGIQSALEYNPFMNYCCNKNAYIFDISRRGLDSITEKCIREIDEIANGLRDYDY